uniref:Alpha/beta hydrolase fold-3 domain-containing protein n=1 Tax=Anolis carolinensis TaxID=28377 RepID=A0A803TKW7_ANOCA|nr:PREDICTED: arylacetamide deacetylase-like 3 [Anolis carolinensis]|eukprot:XP_008122615.2 PREDICTED: arylacetamide deacetylase-like 3 [Anolis carolinensis]
MHLTMRLLEMDVLVIRIESLCHMLWGGESPFINVFRGWEGRLPNGYLSSRFLFPTWESVPRYCSSHSRLASRNSCLPPAAVLGFAAAGMEGLSALWLLLYLSVSVLCFYFGRAVHYLRTRTHIPAEINPSRKLLVLTVGMHFARRLAVFLEKVGLCHRYEAWRLFFKGIAPRKSSALITKDLDFDGVNVRVYWPRTLPAGNARGMVVVPGGFGLCGSIQAYERMSRYIARESNTVVVNVGFRLAPEHPCPAQIQDCCVATEHFLKNAADYGVDPARISIGGESSGASFSAAVCQVLAGKRLLPKLRAQILLYPYLQAVDFNLPSYQQNGSVPPLFRKFTLTHGTMYLTGKAIDVEGIISGNHIPEDLRAKYSKWVSADHVPDEFKARGYRPVEPAPFSNEQYESLKKGLDSLFSPLLAEDNVIRQLPETLLVTSEYDILRDDGILYRKRLLDNGVPVTWHHIEDSVHGMTSTIDFGLLEFPNARRSLQHVVLFLEGL